MSDDKTPQTEFATLEVKIGELQQESALKCEAHEVQFFTDAIRRENELRDALKKTDVSQTAPGETTKSTNRQRGARIRISIRIPLIRCLSDRG